MYSWRKMTCSYVQLALCSMCNSYLELAIYNMFIGREYVDLAPYVHRLYVLCTRVELAMYITYSYVENM